MLHDVTSCQCSCCCHASRNEGAVPPCKLFLFFKMLFSSSMALKKLKKFEWSKIWPLEIQLESTMSGKSENQFHMEEEVEWWWSNSKAGKWRRARMLSSVQLGIFMHYDIWQMEIKPPPGCHGQNFQGWFWRRRGCWRISHQQTIKTKEEAITNVQRFLGCDFSTTMHPDGETKLQMFSALSWKLTANYSILII